MLTISNSQIASVILLAVPNKEYDDDEEIVVFNKGGFTVRCQNSARAIKAVGTKFKKKRKEIAFKDQFKEPTSERRYSKRLLGAFLEGGAEQDLINSVEYFKTHRKTVPVFAKFIKELSDPKFYDTLIIDTQELLINDERTVVTGIIPALKGRGAQWTAIDLKSGVILATNQPSRKILIEKLLAFLGDNGIEIITNHVKKAGLNETYQEDMRTKYGY